jgi:hypothetical protein
MARVEQQGNRNAKKSMPKDAIPTSFFENQSRGGMPAKPSDGER